MSPRPDHLTRATKVSSGRTVLRTRFDACAAWSPASPPERAWSRAPGITRRAFTLVELLVTIVIITLLAAIALGAINSARQTAREAKTKALIAKLNQIIMQRYESYTTRR